MKQKRDDRDRVELKQKKGTWRRFVKLFPKCRLPWVLLAIYLFLDVGLINLGVNETDYTAQLFAGDTSAKLVTTLIVYMVINLLGSSLLVFMRNVTSARITRNMRLVLLDKVFRLPMQYFQSEDPREAVNRIVNRAIVIESTIMLVLIPIFTAAYTAIAIFTRVFTYDWRLSAILLGFIPLKLLIAFLFGRINFSLSERDEKIQSGLIHRLAEMVTNIPLAKAFAKEDREAAKGEEFTGRLYKLNIKSSWLSQFKDISESAVSLLESIAIVAVGILLLGSDSITKRGWISFFLFSSTFSGAITEFMMYWNNLKTIQGGADKVAEIMDAPEESHTGEPCEALSGDIQVEHVCFGYTDETTTLRDISCSFPDGTVTALLGVSGSGKTTLTHLLTRMYPAKEGQITVGGKPITNYALDDYCKHFVVVSQNSLLFSGTLRENICYGNPDVSEKRLVEALKQAQAYDFVMAMPQGLDSRLEEYGNNLSGGQRQRLGIARALLSDAHYLILDEPVASMDAIATAELMDILRTVVKDRCAILIGHTEAILSLADRVIILNNGQVEAEGAVADVACTNRFLQVLMGREAIE